MGDDRSSDLTVPIEIKVIQGSILDADVEVIVNAANSLGIMGGGVAGAIKRAAGAEVDEEARGQAPIPVGRAILTSGGKTRFHGIIHAPTMPQPAMRIDPENVALATRAALSLADTYGFHSLALPGMGTGVGGVVHEEAASLMIQEIRQYTARVLQMVVLVDVDLAMVRAWEACLK
ncbi:MAG TPA: macro domain-containing protein [Nitrospiraceae bacterium]|nr:macro domain-containing protein [Nitrospiraceae bacterium]